MDDPTPRKRSWRRRLFRAAPVAAGLLVAAVGSLPWIAGTPPARRLLFSAAKSAVAGGEIDFKDVELSWLGPTRVHGLSLTDRNGKTLVKAGRASLDRGLLALLRDRNDLGTLTIEGGVLDVERRADGSIDLIDLLSPARPGKIPDPAAAPSPKSPTTVGLTVRVVEGWVRFKTPELPEAFTAHKADVEIRLPAKAVEKLSWKVRLAKPEGGAGGESLGVDGEFDLNAAGAPDLSVVVKGERWPLVVRAGGVDSRVKLDGAFKASRAGGRWASSGDAKLLDFRASGPSLAGDRPALDVLNAAWDVAETEGAWSVRKLGLVCPVGAISANGSVATGPDGVAPDARIEGRVDLAALAKQIPHTMRLRDGLTLERGSVRLAAQVRTDAATGARSASVEANVSDVDARNASHAFTLRDPATLNAKASRTANGFTVEGVEVKTPFLTLSGSGDLEKGVRLNGSVDLAGVEAQLREVIDFGGVQLAGKGRLAAEYRKTGDKFVGRSAAEVRGLRLAGLTADPVERGAVRLDAAASGPADASGLPAAFENVRANLKSDKDTVTFAAANKDGKGTLNAALALPVAFNGKAARAEGKLAGRWTKARPGDRGVVEVDELRLGLTPEDAKLAGSALAFAAKGRYDLDADDLALSPLPLPAGARPAVAVGPEGVRLRGLRTSPLAERAGRVVLVGDLAALDSAVAAWAGQAEHGLGGAYKAVVGLGPNGGKLNLAVSLHVDDLSRPGPAGKDRRPEGPVTIAYSGSYDPAADRLACGAVAFASRYGRVDASGAVDAPTTRRVADLAGTVSPNWETVTRLVAESTEPEARVAGKPRAFRLKGPLAGDSLAGFLKGVDAEVGLELTSADAFGVNLGPTPVVVRCKAGALSVDPIETTLNNGKLVLKPGLVVDDSRGIAVLLGPGSAVENAEINDEVSQRVLTYVAPVLSDATHVRGRVNAQIRSADIPVTGPPDHTLTLTGELAFQNVVFAPGKFANELLAVVGRRDSPGLRIQQPVQLEVANGRVIQKGLEVPVGPDAKVALEGSVGFDQTLDLRARIPITKAMLGGRVSGFDGLVAGKSVTVPVGGTVSRPSINRRALQVALGELSKGALRDEAKGLLDRYAPGAAGNGDANAPGNPAGGGDLKGLENELLRRVLPGGRKP